MNRKRFKLFALRDDLCILAMRGLISQNSVEYTTLRDFLNGSVHVLDKFSATDFLKYLYNVRNDEQLQKKVEIIMGRLHHEDPQYKKIVYQYFDIMYSLYNRHTLLLRTLFFPAILYLLKYGIFSRVLKVVKEKSDQLKEIGSDIEGKRQTACC